MKRLVLASVVAVSLAAITGASADRATGGVGRARMQKGAALGDRQACADLLTAALRPACGASPASATPRPVWRGLN